MRVFHEDEKVDGNPFFQNLSELICFLEQLHYSSFTDGWLYFVDITASFFYFAEKVGVVLMSLFLTWVMISALHKKIWWTDIVPSWQ